MENERKETVSVCAWCPGKEHKTRKLEKEWFAVTHGVCEKCAKKHFPD